MLPSTGYFKSINCPFYDNGACDRPYCHFKHLRREDASTAPLVSSKAVEGCKKSGFSTSPTTNSQIIKHLVSEAVSKVLSDQGVADTEKVSENIVSKVVEGLKPALAPTIGKHSGVPQSITKPPCVYNPTPISELRKRHVALPAYNPARESKVAVKRKCIDDISKPWLSSLPQSGRTRTTELTYKPTAIKTDNGITPDYIPTAKSENSMNSYEDSNSSDCSKRREAYCPRVKSRREEYVPRKIKTPLQYVPQLEEMTVDDFEPEYQNLDNILLAASKNIEKPEQDSQDFFELPESKFSDDEHVDNKNESELATKEVQNSTKSSDEAIVFEEKENDEHKDSGKNNDRKIDQSENTTRNLNTGGSSRRRDSSSSQSHRTSDKEKSNKENSRRDSERSKKEHSSSSSRNRETKENSGEGKESKDKKHSSRSSDRHRSSSSSKHSTRSSKSSHSDRERSSHRSKDKSSQSSRENKSSSKENENHKSSKHDKSKSSSSSRSDSSRRKSSSKSSSERRNSSSNHRSKKSSEKSSQDKGSGSEKNESDQDSSVGGFTNEDELLQTSDSDHDVEEECLKIFQEYQVTDHPKKVTIRKSSKDETKEIEEVEDVGKKRVAHPSAAGSASRSIGPTQPLKKFQNPQQKMYDRWRMMREAAAEQAAKRAENKQIVVEPKPEIKSINIEPQVNRNGIHRRIAMPAPKSVEPKTIAQTTKSGPRVAHVPQTVPQLIRPEPLSVPTQKFPLNVRQSYVNLMQDICVQIYTNGEDAAQRALQEELGCHERCKALSVYRNSCMLAAHRLRKEVDQGESGKTTGPSASGMVSHNAVLNSKNKGSWSVVKREKTVTDFKGSALYCMLKKWIMTEEQLRENGYPRQHPDGPKGRAKVYVTNTRNQSIVSKVPNERYCGRCNQAYMVDKHGMAVQQQNCIYHWGRKYTIRGEGKYSCCQQYGSASGCCDAKNHVWDIVDYENLRGYVHSLPKNMDPENQGVFALDCEMSYTTQGLELTRITVVNEDCDVIYETLVKPDNPIIDYNTRFSGITEESMVGVTISLLDVQANLLTMFSEHTILIGHSLESDFKALKFIHNTVVDTSTVFPHKNGYPFKRALRNLCSEYLQKIIQNDVGGHDSKEDAVACMELIRWKVKEEAKRQ